MSKKNMHDISDSFMSCDRYCNELLISSPAFVSAKNMKKAKQMCYKLCFLCELGLTLLSLSLCKGSSYLHDQSLCHTTCIKKHASYILFYFPKVHGHCHIIDPWMKNLYVDINFFY